jgi:hypothetical protein
MLTRVVAGDATRTHGARLPDELAQLVAPAAGPCVMSMCSPS